jgi:hypothetical protein
MMSGASCLRLSVIDEGKPTSPNPPGLWTSPQVGDFQSFFGKRSVSGGKSHPVSDRMKAWDVRRAEPAACIQTHRVRDGRIPCLWEARCVHRGITLS